MIMEKTGRSRDEAVDLILEAYLTGSQDEMTKIFGEQPWTKVLDLSFGGWQASKIEKVLGGKN